MEAAIDIDWCKYSVASVGQNKYVIMTHRDTRESYKCKTTTKFWGHHAKKAGGILANINKKRGDDPYLPEEWEIERGYTLNPLAGVLRSADLMVEKALKDSGATSYKAFLGEGSSFREGLSTLKKYKDRTQEKPHYLEDVSEHLKKKFKPEIITGIEADDAVVMYCFKRPDRFVIGEDKDYYSCPILNYNVNRPEEGIVDCTGFGELSRPLNDKGKAGKVRGKGRMHLYHQVLYGDDVDTYHAAARSDKKMGSVGAYDRLKDCKDDSEALTSLVEGFKFLYPEPKDIITWKGDEVTIDWLYCMQEMFDMAHMVRFEGDRLNVKNILDKFNVEY